VYLAQLLQPEEATVAVVILATLPIMVMEQTGDRAAEHQDTQTETAGAMDQVQPAKVTLAVQV
jgi:hypothetical protein